jgi:glucose dehydrogenase
VAVRETLALSIGQKFESVRVAGAWTTMSCGPMTAGAICCAAQGARGTTASCRQVASAMDWPSCNGGYSRNRYSEMTQITKANVAQISTGFDKVAPFQFSVGTLSA